MPWHVVESRDGFTVRQVPATESHPVRYIADINSKRKLSTPFRLTVEEALQDGLAVLAQTQQKVWHEYAAGRRARRSKAKAAHSSNPASAPSSSPAPSSMQAPLFVPAAIGGATLAAGPYEQQQPPPAPASLAASAGPSRAAVMAAAAARAAVAEQCPAAAGPFTGSLVQLQRRFHGGLAGMYLLLGRCLGVGGFAAVYLASVVPSSIVTSSSKGGAHMMAAMAAAAAAAAGPAGHSSDAVTFAVKVFHSSKPGVTDGELQRMAAQELRALELLRGYNTAAQLMAVGELVTSPTHSAHSATGIAAANASNSRPSAAAGHMIDVRSGSSSSKLSDDQLPRCAVLELAQFSLHEVVQRLKRCSEVYASAVARELLTFLEAAQSGATGYVITHRDLKPANILVRATGSIAVADFGACHITKAAAAAAAGVSMQTGIGTVMYAPPELYDVPEQSSDSSGGGGGYDGSIDVFALGVIVVEMLAGGGLDGLCNVKEVSKGQLAYKHWEQQLQRLVDGELPLPGGVSVSAAALQFIGCCCGIGKEREAAAAAGQPKRLTPSQLLALPWVQ